MYKYLKFTAIQYAQSEWLKISTKKCVNAELVEEFNVNFEINTFPIIVNILTGFFNKQKQG
jgi:hypothetical protein